MKKNIILKKLRENIKDAEGLVKMYEKWMNEAMIKAQQERDILEVYLDELRYK